MTLLSLNGKPAHVIDDWNYVDYVPDSEWRVKDNEGNEFFTGCLPIDEWDRARMTSVPFEASGIVEWDEKELAERLEDMWAAQSSLMHLMYEYDCLRQQYGTCWVHGLCQMAMVKFVQAGYTKENGLYRIPSPMSIASECYNNFGIRGGYPTLGVEKFQGYGACTVELWPENANTRRYDTPQSKANRNHQIPEEVVELGSGEQGMHRSLCAVAQGIPTGQSFSWWGHFIAVVYGRYSKGQLMPGVWNSWGVSGYGDRGFGLLSGSKRFPRYSVAFLRMRQSKGA